MAPYGDENGGKGTAAMYDSQGRIIGYGPPGYPGESYNGQGMAAINWLVGLGGTPTQAYLGEFGEMPAIGTSPYPGVVKDPQVGSGFGNNGKIYTAFGSGDILPDEQQTVSQTIWSDGSSRMTTFYTSSIQSASNAQYYYDVYQAPPSDATASIQFAVAYGNANGSGSTDLNADAGQAGFSPSRAIYSQYANVLLSPGDDQFTLGNGQGTNSIIAINFQRARVKQKIDPGNWEIWTSGSLTPTGTEAKENVCIDDSGATTNPTVNQAGRVFNIVSGSIASGISSSASPAYLGMVYPDMGIMIFDANALSGSFMIDCAKTNSDTIDNNHYTYLTAISRSATADSDNGMAARNEQKITSTFYFVRVKNREYNFSNNPTFVTGSEGQLRFAAMYKNPQVYIFGIGLYNAASELLAIAKVSRPVLKNYNSEALIKVKLQY